MVAPGRAGSDGKHALSRAPPEAAPAVSRNVGIARPRWSLPAQSVSR
jgi:hypothetical protein